MKMRGSRSIFWSKIKKKKLYIAVFLSDFLIQLNSFCYFYLHLFLFSILISLIYTRWNSKNKIRKTKIEQMNKKNIFTMKYKFRQEYWREWSSNNSRNRNRNNIERKRQKEKQNPLGLHFAIDVEMNKALDFLVKFYLSVWFIDFAWIKIIYDFHNFWFRLILIHRYIFMLASFYLFAFRLLNVIRIRKKKTKYTQK